MNGFGVSPLELMACEAMLAGLAYLDEFEYSAAWIAGTPTALLSGGTVEVQIQINGDSDFVAQEQNLTAFADGDPVPLPNLLLTVTRAGSGREVMNQAQHVGNNCGGYRSSNDGGVAVYPGKKPMAGLINANNILTCKLQNLSTVDFDRVDLDFRGFKVFYIVNQVTGEQGSRQRIFHAL
jgi:hypothetical protein